MPSDDAGFIDIGLGGSNTELSIPLSTNKFRVNNSYASVDGGDHVWRAGTLALTGLSDAPLEIPIWGVGVLTNTNGAPAQNWTISGFVTASLTITGFWTYDGLYDPASGAWTGP